MRKVTAFLKNLKGRKWFWLVFVFFFVIQFVLYPGMLKRHMIYAEDGGVFLDGFQRDGIRSFFTPFSGYLVLTSRIFAALGIGVASIFGHFELAGDVLEVVSSLFIAFILAYFVSDRFEFLIKKRSHRFLLGCLLMLTIISFTGMVFGGVGIHWWCGLLMFLVSLELLNGKLPPLYIYPFVVLCALSSPSGLILGFAVLYYLIKKIFVEKKPRELSEWRTLLFFVIAILSLAIQSYIILFVKNESVQTESFTVQNFINDGSAAFDLTAGSSLFVFTRVMFRAVFVNGVGPFVGILLWALLLFFAKQKKLLKYSLFTLLSIFFLYFMVFFKRDGTIYGVLTDSWSSIFYNALPAALTVIMFGIVLFKCIKSQYYIALIAILLMFVPKLITFRWRPGAIYGLDDAKMEEIDKHLDFSSRQFIKYTYGGNDYDVVHIPVDANYCNEEKVECESI